MQVKLKEIKDQLTEQEQSVSEKTGLEEKLSLCIVILPHKLLSTIKAPTLCKVIVKVSDATPLSDVVPAAIN